MWDGYAPVKLDDDGQMFMELKAVMAAGEKRKIKKRAKKGIAERTRSCLPWRAVPFGLRKRGKREDGHWEEHPDEAPIVRRIFELYLERTSYDGVAKALDAEGVPTPNGGRMWGSSTVRRIITSRSVIGEYWGAGEWRQASTPRSLTSRCFEAVQLVAEQSKRWTPKGGGRLPAEHVFVKGSLRCGLCTSAMIPHTERKRGKVRETYQCRRAKTLGAEACPLPIFDRATVETPALELFETEALSYADTRAHVAAQLDPRIADATTHAARASREAAELRTQADRITRDYRAGTRDAGLHSELRASIAEELTAADAQAERLAAHAEKTTGQRANVDAETVTLEKLTPLHVKSMNPTLIQPRAGTERDRGPELRLRATSPSRPSPRPP